MTAKIIDGKALAARIQDELKTRVEACTEHGHRPGLAVVLVGEDPASQVYVRNKVRACERTGIRSDEIRMPAEIIGSASIPAPMAVPAMIIVPPKTLP